MCLRVLTQCVAQRNHVYYYTHYVICHMSLLQNMSKAESKDPDYDKAQKNEQQRKKAKKALMMM